MAWIFHPEPASFYGKTQQAGRAMNRPLIQSRFPRLSKTRHSLKEAVKGLRPLAPWAKINRRGKTPPGGPDSLFTPPLVQQGVSPPRVEGVGGLADHQPAFFASLTIAAGHEVPALVAVFATPARGLLWCWGCREGSAKRGRRPEAGGAGGAKPQEAVLALSTSFRSLLKQLGIELREFGNFLSC